MTKKVVQKGKFFIPERWDSAQANDGVWFEIADNSGHDWGSFKCSLFDANVPRVKHAAQRYERKAKAQRKYNSGKSDEAINIRSAIDMALDIFLHDWRVEGPDGEVPFTRENAHEYFGMQSTDKATGETTFPVFWVLDRVYKLAANDEHFQPEDQEGDATGN